MALAFTPLPHTPRSAGFSVRSLDKEFKVAKVGLGQVFSEYFRFRPAVIPSPALRTYSSIIDTT